MSSVHLAIRLMQENPNHHLWNNNGTWFVHYTVYPDRLTAERRRESLHTRCLTVARERRDRLFAAFSPQGNAKSLSNSGFHVQVLEPHPDMPIQRYRCRHQV